MFSVPGKAGGALAACALIALLAAAGCSSGPGQPSWASALGSGVTVVSPGSASPGNASPDEVLAGIQAVVASGHYTDLCKYEEPSLQSNCNANISQVTPAEAASQLPTIKNFALGYTAIDGDKALVGVTGTVCVPRQTPDCYTNSDPAAILDSGKPFATLWSESVAAPPNVYSPSPVIEVNGSWYAYATSS